MASIDETKETIRATPISSIISFYHPIKKKGANYQGVCPFHGDTNPSLSVNDDRGIYKCFACDAGGDAIKFVMDFANLNFVEAIKDIGSKLGIQVEEKKRKLDPRVEMGERVLKFADKLYRKFASDVKPGPYMDFLKQRKLNDESVENFKVSYAPGNSALTKQLGNLPEGKERDFAIKVAKEIGIIRENQRGPGHYDFFRDRVMFPIWDHAGKVRGFSSRAVLPNQKPKYLNSGESFIFDKGNILYGFNIAKKHIRQQDAVLIAEGQMDVISLHQYGFNYAVGTSGVALSSNSARILTNMAKTIYLGMDSDPAGMKAMGRINEMFMELGVLPKFISYAPEKDPDDFLKEHGRLELLDRMEKAKTFLDVSIEEAIPNPIPETVDQKLETLRKIFDLISPLKEGLMAKEKVVVAAKALGLRSSEEDIITEYKAHLKTAHQPKVHKKQAVRAEKKPAPQQDPGPSDMDYRPDDGHFMEGPPPGFFEEEVAPQERPQKATPLKSGEKVTLESLLTNPECIQSEQILEILDLIDQIEVQRLIQWLRKIYLEIDESDYVHMLKSKLSENFSSPVKDVIASALNNHNKLKLEPKTVEKLLKDCRVKLQMDKLRQIKKDLALKQKESPTEAESVDYLNKILEVEKQLRDLKYNKN